jgi:hypothetical protein
MYPWLKILETNRLSGEKQEDDLAISDWQSLAFRFISEVEIAPEYGDTKSIAVDCFPFLFELLNAAMNIPLKRPFLICIGEGWMIDGASVKSGYNLEIVFDVAGKRKLIMAKELSFHETMLFVSVKLSELITSLEGIGVNPDGYFIHFPPSSYQT